MLLRGGLKISKKIKIRKRKKQEKNVSDIWEDDPNFVYIKQSISSKNLSIEKEDKVKSAIKPEIDTMKKISYEKTMRSPVEIERKPVFRKEKKSRDFVVIKELQGKIERKNNELMLKNNEIIEIKKQLQQISNDAISIKKNFDKRKNDVEVLKKVIKKQEADIDFFNRQVDTKDQLIRHLSSVIEKKNDELFLLNKKTDSGFEKDKPSLKEAVGISVMKSKQDPMIRSDDVDWVVQDLMNEKSVKLSEDELMFKLLDMIYPDDVSDVELVTKKLGISDNELKNLVDIMVSKGFLRFTDKNEAEITVKGINYVTAH